jgi:hypothetical protein
MNEKKKISHIIGMGTYFHHARYQEVFPDNLSREHILHKGLPFKLKFISIIQTGTLIKNVFSGRSGTPSDILL